MYKNFLGKRRRRIELDKIGIEAELVIGGDHLIYAIKEPPIAFAESLGFEFPDAPHCPLYSYSAIGREEDIEMFSRILQEKGIELMVHKIAA